MRPLQFICGVKAVILLCANAAVSQVFLIEPDWVPVPVETDPSARFYLAPTAAYMPPSPSTVIERYYFLPAPAATNAPKNSTQSAAAVPMFYLPPFDPIPASIIIREYYVPDGAMLTSTPTRNTSQDKSHPQKPDAEKPEKLTAPEWKKEFETLSDTAPDAAIPKSQEPPPKPTPPPATDVKPVEPPTGLNSTPDAKDLNPAEPPKTS